MLNKFIIITCVFFIDLGAFLSVRTKNNYEKRLIDREHKYRLLSEKIKDVIWLYNVNRQEYSYISPSVLDLTGFTVEQAKSQSFDVSLDYESAKRVAQKS